MSRGIQKIIDAVEVPDAEVIKWFGVNDARLIALDIKNSHATETLDYSVYGRITPDSGSVDILQAQGTLAATIGVLLTIADIAKLDDGYREIGIGYERTSENQNGTLTVFIARTF